MPLLKLMLRANNTLPKRLLLKKGLRRCDSSAAVVLFPGSLWMAWQAEQQVRDLQSQVCQHCAVARKYNASVPGVYGRAVAGTLSARTMRCCEGLCEGCSHQGRAGTNTLVSSVPKCRIDSVLWSVGPKACIQVVTRPPARHGARIATSHCDPPETNASAENWLPCTRFLAVWLCTTNLDIEPLTCHRTLFLSWLSCKPGTKLRQLMLQLSQPSASSWKIR